MSDVHGGYALGGAGEGNGGEGKAAVGGCYRNEGHAEVVAARMYKAGDGRGA